MSYESVISRAQPGCLVLMLDQSASMLESWGADGFKKAEVLADTVNELLKTAVVRCTSGTTVRDYFDVAVVGYGNDLVRDVLSNNVEQLLLHPMSRVAEDPVRIEDRIQTIEDAHGQPREVPYRMPIWINASGNGNTPMVAAFEAVEDVVTGWVTDHPDSYPPVVINITDAVATDGDPLDAAAALRALSTSDGSTLLFNIHISASADKVVLFPQDSSPIRSDQYALRLFEMSSVLPASMVRAAGDAGFDVGPGSKAFAHNTDPANLIEILDIGTTPLLGPRQTATGR